jgi:hypothetical protein
MLLYLAKYSRPDIRDILRELCKFMDGARMGTHLEILRAIKFAPDTENFCLEILK